MELDLASRSRIVNLNRSWIGRLIKNQLIAGSFVLFMGNIILNFGGYLYHLLMVRMLGPVDYGVLASLISLAYLFGVPFGALNWVVVKYVSALRGKKEFGVISYFYHWLNKKLLIYGLAGFFFLIIISPWLASFLHLDSVLLLLLIITSSLVGIYLMVNTSVLQGFLRFGLISISGAIQAVLKVGIAVLLVYWGWKVLGAVLAILVSMLSGYLLTVFFVIPLLKKQKPTEKRVIDSREIIEYAIPVFFSTFAFTSLYTTDIVLVRHFLPPLEAGFYAALANLGKIIFFASTPITMVMFPIVSEKHANGRKYENLLNQSLGLAFLVCLAISGIYFLLPGLMIKILYGSELLLASPYLWLFAIFLSFYSLSYLVTSFYLSIKKVKVVILPIMAALSQIVLISFFHQDLRQTALVSVIVMALLFFLLLLYSKSEKG